MNYLYSSALITVFDHLNLEQSPIKDEQQEPDEVSKLVGTIKNLHLERPPCVSEEWDHNEWLDWYLQWHPQNDPDLLERDVVRSTARFFLRCMEERYLKECTILGTYSSSHVRSCPLRFFPSGPLHWLSPILIQD
ncbi:hypothetical protein NEOLEDRAFT_722117 [Neolentinus lepideus HHB14362 ss-1]|uniref:Uncharacterized protein n=1 Tax=Neolentinus lepideus HHB14362 ss-1 TaxID=1314782 RepID=A0A165Q2H1_9AGAM|nr:hypothetical protein NEOLEDRAFT_722117 [Neolentinus lepideus HHB14362 ss-1]